MLSLDKRGRWGNFTEINSSTMQISQNDIRLNRSAFLGLRIPPVIKQHLAETAKEKELSMTDYVIQLITADMKEQGVSVSIDLQEDPTIIFPPKQIKMKKQWYGREEVFAKLQPLGLQSPDLIDVLVVQGLLFTNPSMAGVFYRCTEVDNLVIMNKDLSDIQPFKDATDNTYMKPADAIEMLQLEDRNALDRLIYAGHLTLHPVGLQQFLLRKEVEDYLVMNPIQEEA